MRAKLQECQRPRHSKWATVDINNYRFEVSPDQYKLARQLFLAGQVRQACIMLGRGKSWFYALAASEGWSRLKHASRIAAFENREQARLDAEKAAVLQRWPVVDGWVQVLPDMRRTYYADFVHVQAAWNTKSAKVERVNGRPLRMIRLPTGGYQEFMTGRSEGVQCAGIRWYWTQIAGLRRLYVLA